MIMWITWKGLYQHIGNVVLAGTVGNRDAVGHDVFMKKMMLDVDVFGTGVELQILCKFDCSAIVDIDLC